MRTRNYEDNKQVRHYITEVFVDYMEMLTPKVKQPAVPAPAPLPSQQPAQGYNQQAQQQAQQPAYQQQPAYPQVPPPNDLPF